MAGTPNTPRIDDDEKSPTRYNGDDILATAATLNFPEMIVLDASGNIYISDTWNHRIRKVTASTGMISTVAGTGTVPSDFQPNNGEGGLATAASL